MNVTTEKKANAIGFTELKKWLRHRHPMIYIDRVLDYEPSEYFQCMMSVSGTMDCSSWNCILSTKYKSFRRR